MSAPRWTKLGRIPIERCGTDDCGRLAIWRFDAGDVGTQYCDVCRIKIEAQERIKRYPPPPKPKEDPSP